jgi:hypothetical protein
VIRAIGYLISEALWAVVHRFLDPYATWDDEPNPDADADARIRWINDHRPGGAA